jgi:dienelactone hydrolase
MVQGPKVGVTGTSRGSEAALQLAALTPKVGGVVAYVPSGIRWMGVDGEPSWTHQGKVLPYVQWPNDFDESDEVVAKVDRFNRVLDEQTSYTEAEIEVEKASCPILLLSGKDDQLWPSERMAYLIVKRLEKHDYAYPCRHIAYPNAGHRIKVPGLGRNNYVPVSEDAVTGETLQLGGTYEGNKAASERSWGEALDFFRSVFE